MRAHLLLAVLATLMSVLAGCGGDDVTDSTGDTDSDSAESTAGEEAEPTEEVDNCSLLSNEEVTALAGYELVAGEDSPLGCPYIAPGEDIADVRVVAVTRPGGAQAVAEEAFPDAPEIIPVDVGADTVAVTDPSGDTIASVLTADGDRLVELSVIFLFVSPDDTARIEEAAQLAVTALERFGG